MSGPRQAGVTFSRRYGVALVLIVVSLLFYAIAALETGQYSQLTLNGVMGLLQRMVALGFVALGQMVVISSGAIDLSVANLVSLCAVLSAYLMHDDPARIAEAVIIVLAVAALIGSFNGVLVALLGVNPLIATLGTSLMLQGVLSVSFHALKGSVPREFQQFAYGLVGGIPVSVIGLLALALVTGTALSHTRIGSRLFAVGGNPKAARLAGIRGAWVTIPAFAFSGMMCAVTGLYLASRLGVGTPWIGRDGNYDLGSIAAVVIGGTLLSGGRGSIAGALAGVLLFAATDAMVNMLQIDPFVSQNSARGDRCCRRRALHLPRAGGSGMKRVLKAMPALPLLIVLLAVMVYMSPLYQTGPGLMIFLQRAAPLVVLACGTSFVLIAGGFDLSAGSLITLVVIAGAMVSQGQPALAAPAFAAAVAIGLLVGMVNGAVVAYVRVPSIITTLGTLLSVKGIAMAWSGGAPTSTLPENFRYLGRGRIHGVPVIGSLPISVIVLVVVCLVAYWLLHKTNFGRMVFMLGDNPKAAMLAGVPTRRVRIACFVVSSLTAVVAGLLLGGYSGVSVDVGGDYALQAIAAAVIGGVALLGGRGSIGGAACGALALYSMFTVLNLFGVSEPVRLAVQGLILIVAAALATQR